MIRTHAVNEVSILGNVAGCIAALFIELSAHAYGRYHGQANQYQS
jgi:hypothetical protein